jgi:NADPH-dependent glutamate synthase beta subunit-like oxidoreductase
MDSARTCLRLGAKWVDVYYRRTREEMPVTDNEYREAAEEGIRFHFLTNPTRIVSENWKVKGLQCIRMRLGQPDETGRRRPVPIEDSEFFAPADTVIAAVGQAPDLSFLPPDSKLERAHWGTLQVDGNTLSTNVPGVFAGGDFVTGPTTAIQAIAAGRRGALAIDKFLRGDFSRVEIRDESLEVDHEVDMAHKEEVIELKPRCPVPALPPKERTRGFDEIEIGYTEEQAMEEARRCLRCDLAR